MMFWDGRSKGTGNNIDYMEKLGKYYIVSGKNGIEERNLMESATSFIIK
jgi:hypothetical protein